MTVLDLVGQEFDLPVALFAPDLPGDARALVRPFVTQALRVVAEALDGPNREEMARWVLDRYLATLPTTVQQPVPQAAPLPARTAEDSCERERAESFPEASLRRQFGLAAYGAGTGSSWRDWG